MALAQKSISPRKAAHYSFYFLCIKTNSNSRVGMLILPISPHLQHLIWVPLLASPSQCLLSSLSSLQFPGTSVSDLVWLSSHKTVSIQQWRKFCPRFQNTNHGHILFQFKILQKKQTSEKNIYQNLNRINPVTLNKHCEILVSCSDD